MQMNAQPQIYHAVNFLANYFVRFLPKATCSICTELLIQNITKGKGDDMFPDRPFCGHWVHQKCLENVLSNPPFSGVCSVTECGEKLMSVRHPNDPSSFKNREKKHNQEQQKKGEEDDLDKLFGI